MGVFGAYLGSVRPETRPEIRSGNSSSILGRRRFLTKRIKKSLPLISLE